MNNVKRVNALHNTTRSAVWRENYYEHSVRDEKAHNAIKLYIQNNPVGWERDKENPYKGS